MAVWIAIEVEVGGSVLWARVVRGVEGMGMAAAASCRAEKSARWRPRGRVGGWRRWRLGVEGAVVVWGWGGVEGVKVLESESVSVSERRRFFEVGGCRCGCCAFVIVWECGAGAGAGFLGCGRLGGSSMIGLASEG